MMSGVFVSRPVDVPHGKWHRISTCEEVRFNVVWCWDGWKQQLFTKGIWGPWVIGKDMVIWGRILGEGNHDRLEFIDAEKRLRFRNLNAGLKLWKFQVDSKKNLFLKQAHLKINGWKLDGIVSGAGYKSQGAYYSYCLKALSLCLDFFCGNSLSTNHRFSWLVMIFFNVAWLWDHPLMPTLMTSFFVFFQVVPGAVIALHPEWGRTAGVWVCSDDQFTLA